LEVVEKVCSNVRILRKGEVVAYDSIDRLRELMSQASLEGVFGQLVEAEDSETVASEILDVMSSGSEQVAASGGAADTAPPGLQTDERPSIFCKSK
jgi:hypothetical protein